MKKILISLMAIALVIGMLGMGAFAYFSDVETSTGNTFTAGTLNLTVGETYTLTANVGTPAATVVISGSGDGANIYANIGGNASGVLVPGDSGTITWVLTNAGTVQGTIAATVTGTSDENTLLEPESAASDTGADEGDLTDGELDTCLQFSLTRNGTAVDINGAGAGGGLLFNLGALVTYLGAENETMSAGETLTYVLSWSIPADVIDAGADGYFDVPAGNVNVDDNVIQSDDAVLNMSWTITQTQS